MALDPERTSAAEVSYLFGPVRHSHCPSCGAELTRLAHQPESSIPNRYNDTWQYCTECTWMSQPTLWKTEEQSGC